MFQGFSKIENPFFIQNKCSPKLYNPNYTFEKMSFDAEFIDKLSKQTTQTAQKNLY